MLNIVFKSKNDLEVFEHFDPCMRMFKKLVRSECHICPLSDCAINKVVEDLDKNVRTSYLANSYRYPLLTAARLSLQAKCDSVICFSMSNYPISRSPEEITANGVPTYQLYTEKSFDYFFERSVGFGQVVKMTVQDVSRFMRYVSSLKPLRFM